MTFQLRRSTHLIKNYGKEHSFRRNIKCFGSDPDQSSVRIKNQPRMGNQLPHVFKLSKIKDIY